MANPGVSIGPSRGHRRSISTDIVEKARLEVFVAEDSNLDIKDFLSSRTKSQHLAVHRSDPAHPVPALSSLTQRQHLFFDEDVPVFIALQILGIQDDAVYESYSSRLAVSLEVTAVEGHSGRRADGNRQPQEGPILLYQKTIQDKDGGRILWREGDTRLAIWKITVPLGHPKARPNNPKVVFSASATLRFLRQNTVLPENEYISSRQALNVNILESFGADTPERLPYLSALRVSRVVPTQPAAKESFSPLGYSSKKVFPIVPGLNFKLRGSKTPQSSKSQNLFAHLTLEVTPHLGCDFEIQDVLLQTGGSSIPSIEASEGKFPITLQIMDEISFLFPLPHSTTPGQPHSLLKHLVLKLKGIAMVSDICRPQISTHWETSVDFSPHFTSHQGGPQATLRPSTRPLSSSSSNAGFNNATIADGSGLTITFTATTSSVHPGDIFSWRVFVINRSNRARRLALLVPPKRRKGEGKILPSIPHNMTEPVVEDAPLYSSYKSQHLEAVELVPLVNDVRIGPLAPNACHTAELRFIALATGVLTVEGVRVVDLMTNDISECRDLPTVVCT